jgi:transcription elongation factor GreB
MDDTLEKKLRNPLTREGYEKISAEWIQLFKVERPKVVDGIATAAAEGDRSENAEYIYGKKKLRELDKRIRYLDKLLKDAQIIDPGTTSTDQVSFGSLVTVEDENGEEKTWRIVGEGESDYKTHRISWKSPVARAIFGKKIGDTVLAHRPMGTIEYTILSISV